MGRVSLGYCVVCDTAKVRFFKQITTCSNYFIIYCLLVVCDTAKVRFFKQITTAYRLVRSSHGLFAILQKYDFSSKSQPACAPYCVRQLLFAILQKYDFSSKSQQNWKRSLRVSCCLRYCKSTIFQANHNLANHRQRYKLVVCDTAKVRFFKQITTKCGQKPRFYPLFAILQKYDFSSKSQPVSYNGSQLTGCLRYCKSTIFQANHNLILLCMITFLVVCDTAKVRFFKQITTDNFTF